MKYPIIAYGDPVLKKKATAIEPCMVRVVWVWLRRR
jgi:hypothetical protein